MKGRKTKINNQTKKNINKWHTKKSQNIHDCSFISRFIPPKRSCCERYMLIGMHNRFDWACKRMKRNQALLGTRSPFMDWTCWKVTTLRNSNTYKTYYATVIVTKTKAIKLSLWDNGMVSKLRTKKKRNWYKKSFSIERFWICAVA